mmetsp:Transcript_95748/g.239912  ORF Transcript_95748/g.239912 Transcript_95748/m.239912 type:complete len:225 (+) Transcript_95748:1400-2074(+)
MPVFMSLCSSLVSVALKSPVLRCFGTTESTSSMSEANPSCKSRSASSKIKASRDLKLIVSLPAMRIIALKRPGVATTICSLPRSSTLQMSSTAAFASVPPTNKRLLNWSPPATSWRRTAARYFSSTSWIWPVSSRVGDKMAAPMLKVAAARASHRSSISTTGMRKANVLPDPVQASTATSLFFSSNGMAIACTGVIRLKPASSMNCRVAAETCKFDQSREPMAK